MVINRTLRSLFRNPAFTITTVVSLGFALAVSATLVAITDSLLHPPVPYSDPSRVFIAALFGGDKRNRATPIAQERALREALQGVASVAAFSSYSTVVSVGSSADHRSVTAASPELFDVLGVHPIAGRTFAPGVGAGDPQVAVVSFGMWKRLFNARPLAPGTTIAVGSSSYTVVGVLPRGVRFPLLSDVWIPLSATASDAGLRTAARVIVFRLKPGQTLEAARHRLSLSATRLAEEHGQTMPYAERLEPLSVRVWQPWITLYAFAVVALVLAIAGANLGTMMLARGMARRRETAIRIALGAGRWAIAKEVFAECAVVILAGTCLGLLLTMWALHMAPTVTLPSGPDLVDISPTPSWRVFAFAAVVAGAILLFGGFAPALRAANADPAEPMKEGGGLTGRMRDRYNPLLVLEIALSTGLLLSAALFALFAGRLAAFDFTYDAKRLVTAQVSLRSDGFPSGTDLGRVYDDLLVRLAQLPGAASAATRSFERPARAIVVGEDGSSGIRRMIVSTFAVVSPMYLRTVRIPVVAGRDFEPGDRASTDGVVIVDEHAARLLWPHGGTPVGHLVKLGPEESNRPWLPVVGVARWTELYPRSDPDLPPEPQIYVVSGHDLTRDREVIVRSGRGGDRGLAELAVLVRREVQALAPGMVSPRVRPWLEEHNNRLGMAVVLASALAAFGMLGLVLCAIGLYGTLAYSVSRRRREFGVRIALGAQPSNIIRLVVHDNVVTILAGIGAGAGGALIVMRRLSEELVGAHFELVTALLIAEGLLLLTGAIACMGPVMRAARTDPVDALRTA